MGLDVFLCFLLGTQNYVLDQSSWSTTFTFWRCFVMLFVLGGSWGCASGIVLPLALQGEMFQHCSLAPGASARVPAAPFLANQRWFSVHFYKPGGISNGPLFILLCCCVLGHQSLPNNRWKRGFIWVINYVLPLSTGSAGFSSAFSHPWAPLVKDAFLPLSSTIESLAKLRKNTLSLYLKFALCLSLAEDVYSNPGWVFQLFQSGWLKILLHLPTKFPTSFCVLSQLLWYQRCDLCLFAIYLITEGLLKSLNTPVVILQRLNEEMLFWILLL